MTPYRPEPASMPPEPKVTLWTFFRAMIPLSAGATLTADPHRQRRDA